MKVNSGTVAKAYSVTLSPMAIFSRFMASWKLSRISQMPTNDTIASAIGM